MTEWRAAAAFDSLLPICSVRIAIGRYNMIKKKKELRVILFFFHVATDLWGNREYYRIYNITVYRTRARVLLTQGNSRCNMLM